MRTFLRLALAGLALAAATPSSAAPCTADDFAKVVDDPGARIARVQPRECAKLQPASQTEGEEGLGRRRGRRNGARLPERRAAFELRRDVQRVARQARHARPARPGQRAGLRQARRAQGCEPRIACGHEGEVGLSHRQDRRRAWRSAAPKAGETPVAAAPAPEAKPQPPAAHPSPAPPAAPAPATPPAPAQAAPKPAPPVAPKVAAAPPAPVPSPKPPAAPKAPSSPSSSTTTAQHPEATAAAPPGTPLALPPAGTFVPPEEGYTIEEIRDATRGFFGAASTNLATMLEHTFSESGRPTAYVLGQEGGGAFLAGLRYGSGTLYLRAGGTMPVYWHGPSLGYDFGAAGWRTFS